MTARSIDGMIRAYFTWKRGLGASGLNPVEQEGLVWTKNCECDRELRRTNGLGDPICGHCGAMYAMEAQVRLRGTFQRSPRVNPEARLAGWVDIGVVLGSFMHERRQLAEVLLRRVEMGQSQRAVAAELGWSRERVRAAEDQARRELAWRFDRAGFDVG